MDGTIRISDPLYQIVAKETAARRRSPDEFAEEVLARQLIPPHPHVEVVESRSGPRAIIRGTRIGVDVVLGYFRAGCTPEEIASEVLPRLGLARVYDALSYYHDHRQDIDRELAMREDGAWQSQLRERLGEAAYARLTGEPLSG